MGARSTEETEDWSLLEDVLARHRHVARGPQRLALSPSVAVYGSINYYHLYRTKSNFTATR